MNLYDVLKTTARLPVSIGSAVFDHSNLNIQWLCILTLLTGCGEQDSRSPDSSVSSSLQCEVQLPDSSGSCVISPLSADGLIQSEQTFDDGRRVIQNVTYGSRGGLSLQADLYLPPVINPDAGALITLHGGGWQDCGRRRSVASPVALVMSGLLGVPVLNIDYRLRQEGGGYPNNLSDVMCAAQFLSGQAESYGFESGRVALMGESAGAHLALMGSLIGDRQDIDPDCGETPEIVASIAVSPPTDFPAAVVDQTDVAPAMQSYTGSQCRLAASCSTRIACDSCVDASPIAHACKPGDSRYLLAHAAGNYDPFIEDTHINDFYLAMKSGGASVELVTADETALSEAGCPPGTPVHGFTDCLTSVVGASIIDVLEKTLK